MEEGATQNDKVIFSTIDINRYKSVLCIKTKTTELTLGLNPLLV